jgi:phosphatidylserine/phosphatidylglycerophosphate/cardiolipin synthase-like enzyme
MKVRVAFVCLGLFLNFLVLIPAIPTLAQGSPTGIVINEIMYDPESGDSGNEWIELYNNGTSDVNMTGWVISDQDGGDDFVFPSLEIPAGAYIVVHTGSGVNETDFGDGIGHFYMFLPIILMENTGDDILLTNSSGDSVDYVAYDFGGFVDPAPVDIDWDDMNAWVESEGHSISLLPNGMDMDSGLFWEESDPTPGAHNSHLMDEPPSIVDVSHSPQNPATSEPVNISAQVTDDYSLDSVGLEYSIDGISQVPLYMIFDGTNYTISLGSFAEGTVVTYRVVAVDDAQKVTYSQVRSYAHSDTSHLVVINEFLANPESDWNGDGYNDSDDEWIELYNPGDLVVNIGGWILDDKLGPSGSSDPYTIPFGCFIKPKGYKVFFGNETDVILNDFGEESVHLMDEGETVVDSYSFDGTTDDATFGRYSDGSENWEDFLLPTPGSANQYTVDTLSNLNSVVINEFLPNPKSLFSKEWIELYNSGSNSVRLDGCYLDDVIGSGINPWRIPLNTILGAGERIVFERTFGLNNAGDTVNLVFADGITVLDTYSYSSSEYDISYGRAENENTIKRTFSNPTPGEPNPNASGFVPISIVICRLFYRSSEETEFLVLYNTNILAADIGGWRISDGINSYSGTMIFPQGSQILPREHLYVANTATVFNDIMGFLPDFEYGNSSDVVPEMDGGEPPTFAMNGDEVRFMSDVGILEDIVVYGDSDYDGPGWEGAPIADAGKGEYLFRNYNDTLSFYYDTDSNSDWEHMRQYKVGQSDFNFTVFSYNGSLTVFASPDSAFDTIASELDNAQSEILIGMYEFTNWNISEKIIERIHAGVSVKILMEGSPVGGISQDQKYLLSKIHEAGGEVRFLVTNSSLGPRYNFLHAKYAVLDSSSVIISSENWKYSGIPVDNTYGNRGWGVVIRDPESAGYFSNVFFTDWNGVIYDIFPFDSKDPVYGNASATYVPDNIVPTDDYDPVFSSMTFTEEVAITPVLAPDTTLLDDRSIIGHINSARSTISIQQMDLDLSWDFDGREYDNHYLQAVLDAAEKRGVDVKILLSSRYSYPDNPALDNYDTVEYINNYAENHNISDNLEARLFNYNRLGLSKLHNKGMIIDGQRTLISSINWVRNSVAQNREVGVIVESEQVAEYFEELFFWDWNEPPTASAGEDMTIEMNTPVKFNSRSTDPDGNASLTYLWDFDDGSNSTDMNPQHVYDRQGVYTVTLTVSDGQYSDTHSITVIVLEEQLEGPSLGNALVGVLLIIFVIIFILIIAFIRKMKYRFL